MHLGSTASTSSRLFSGAFLTSVTLHAIAGGFLLSQWQSAVKPLPAPRVLQIALLETRPPVPALPVSIPALQPAAEPVESAEPVQPLVDPTPDARPLVEAAPSKVEIEPAEPQADKPQPAQAEKIKPKAQPKIVRDSAKKRAEPLRQMAKARPVPRETVASPAMPSTAIPVETTPVQDAGDESDGKASDDVTRGETTTANSANPASPALAAAAQPPATVIAATRPTPSPAVAAGPVVPPHFEVAYLDNPKPAYPLAARRLKLEGTVVLRVLVKASGAPETIALGQSSGAAILDEAALAAVKSWRFVPAHQGERAIDHWVDVPIRFRLVEAGR